MTCFKPLNAWQTSAGDIKFVECAGATRKLTLPCGRCIGCRMRRSRDWAIRCMHEAQMHDRNVFVTLTYDDGHSSPSLDYTDFQLFMKRLRSKLGSTRFFVAGEYGDNTKRPHFHALLFGMDFDGRKRITKTLYRSPILESLWPYGFSSIGSVTFQSAAYVAKYCCKKVTGPMAEDHYKRVNVKTGEVVDVVPEFAHMSLKPGIGYPWFVKYWTDVYAARDGVIVDGKKLPAPKYYDRLLENIRLDVRTDKDFDRYLKSKQFEADCTPERLAVREVVAQARNDIKQRKL